MNEKLSKPKSVGEILDLTFRLCKERFRDLFVILLILVGPIFALQALVQLVDGVGLVNQTVSGGGDGAWYEQIANRFVETEASLGATVMQVLLGLLRALMYIVAQASIIVVIFSIQKNEDYTWGSAMKRAFTRFWPALGSGILFLLMLFGFMFVTVMATVMVGFFAASTNSTIGIIIAVLIGLVSFIAMFYLFTRWSFYFASVIIDEEVPGFGRSWRLTKGRTLKLIGLYMIIFIIISVISLVVEGTLGLLLGNSVLLGFVSNIVTLITTMVFVVGYTVMYLDLKTRHDADDLKEMLEDYQGGNHVPVE